MATGKGEGSPERAPACPPAGSCRVPAQRAPGRPDACCQDEPELCRAGWMFRPSKCCSGQPWAPARSMAPGDADTLLPGPGGSGSAIARPVAPVALSEGRPGPGCQGHGPQEHRTRAACGSLARGLGSKLLIMPRVLF